MSSLINNFNLFNAENSESNIAFYEYDTNGNFVNPTSEIKLKNDGLIKFNVLNNNKMILNNNGLTSTIGSMTNIKCSSFTDGIIKFKLGSLTNGKFLSLNTLTNNVATLKKGTLTGLTNLVGNITTISKYLKISSLSDGTVVLNAGSLTGALFTSTKTITDSIATLKNGNFTGLKLISSSTITDNVATLKAGTFNSLNQLGVNITSITKILKIATLTNSIVSLENSKLSGLKRISSSTITDGVATLKAGSLTNFTTFEGLSGSFTLVYGIGSNLSNLNKLDNQISRSYTKAEALDTGSNGLVKFITNNSERMRINNSGNVGIGTSAPESSLHIAGNKAATPTTKGIHLGGSTDYGIEICAAGNSNNSHIDFTYPNKNMQGRIQYNHNSTATISNMDFMTGESLTPRMRIHGNGKVMIRETTETSLTCLLDINDNANQNVMRVKSLQSTTRMLISVTTLTSPNGNQNLEIGKHHNGDAFFWLSDSHNMTFSTAATLRMQISWDGKIGIGTNSPETYLHIKEPSGSTGIKVQHSGGAFWQQYVHSNGNYHFSNGNVSPYINGTISSQMQNNFTGQHRSMYYDKSINDIKNLEGLIVCANKNKYTSMSGSITVGNNAITINECLPDVKLCIKEKDKSVFGVISITEDPNERKDSYGCWCTPFDKETGDIRPYINSVGEGGIWVSNKNGNLESGDYITSSSIPGYGMKQNEFILYNFTVGKITMDCDFNPQSFYKKIILKDSNGDNILDSNGYIQFANHQTETELQYNIRYLQSDGTIITESDYNTKLANNESVYKAAFVGCTYHCG